MALVSPCVIVVVFITSMMIQHHLLAVIIIRESTNSVRTSSRSLMDGMTITQNFGAITSTKERLQQNKIDNSISANKLQFDRLRGSLFGRSKEIATLNECLSRLQQQQLPKQKQCTGAAAACWWWSK